MGLFSYIFKAPCRGDFERNLYDKHWTEKEEHKRKMNQGKLQEKYIEQGRQVKEKEE